MLHGFGIASWSADIRDAFGKRVAHGVIQKAYSATHLNINEVSRRYSPAQVVAVAREAESDLPAEISTSPSYSRGFRFALTGMAQGIELA